MSIDDRIPMWIERADTLVNQKDFDFEKALELSLEIRNAGVGIGVIPPATVAVLAIEQALNPGRSQSDLIHARSKFEALRIALTQLA